MNYNTFKQSLKKLIQHYTQGEFKSELSGAQKDFFENAGLLDENKPSYNLRMHQFYEWYFLSRPLKAYMKTPLQVCDQHRDLRLTDEDNEAVEILKQTQLHRIYEFIKIKGSEILVKDLLTNKKIEVQLENLVFGFDSKEFFQARTVDIDGKKYFLDSFCFHPEASQKFILSEIKVIQKDPDLNIEDLLLRLNKMRYKFEQYKHVKPELIYTNENKLGL